MTQKKALLVANRGWYLYNFRLPLARLLKERGIQPVFLSPKDAYVEKLIALGFHWRELALNRRSMNPLLELCALWEFVRIYRQEKPEIVHHFTIKCVLYGTIAARLLKVPAVINAVTGLGHIFVDTSLRTTLLRPLIKILYRFVLTTKRVRVIFQNADDLNAFAKLKLVDRATCRLIRSSGVDIQRFQPKTIPGNKNPTILFASRLLLEKGIVELVEAVTLLRQKGIPVILEIAGTQDLGNPSSITDGQIDNWKQLSFVQLLGHIDQIEKVIERATLVVLPSYREGVPRILLEAAAMAKPIIATDVPGCREIIQHQKTGILVPARDTIALAQGIELLLANTKLQQTLGEQARAKVVAEFNDKDIAVATAQVYGELI